MDTHDLCGGDNGGIMDTGDFALLVQRLKRGRFYSNRNLIHSAKSSFGNKGFQPLVSSSRRTKLRSVCKITNRQNRAQ
jgi:hypothetical protein